MHIKGRGRGGGRGKLEEEEEAEAAAAAAARRVRGERVCGGEEGEPGRNCSAAGELGGLSAQGGGSLLLLRPPFSWLR